MKRNTIKRASALSTVADFCEAMEAIAPTGLAQDWDNVGLIAGDPTAPLKKALLTIDLTHEVVAEAEGAKVDLVVAYHPPIFKPIASLRADSPGMEALVFQCIRRGIAIYATHTALDAANGGTNDVLADLCGIASTQPLEHVDDPTATQQCKIVVFVPRNEVESVAEAMFNAGAGQIGDYSRCAFRVDGRGSFLGGANTEPTIGQRGRLELVEEVRLEVVAPQQRLAAVVDAMRKAHSYEEPTFDIYPLKRPPANGIGRVGRLPKPVALAELGRRLARSTGAQSAQLVGQRRCRLDRAVIVAGSAGSLPFRIPLTPSDVIITGEIRHHDAISIQRAGCSAIALGHWASERPVLRRLSERLRKRLVRATVIVSSADADPFQQI